MNQRLSCILKKENLRFKQDGEKIKKLVLRPFHLLFQYLRTAMSLF